LLTIDLQSPWIYEVSGLFRFWGTMREINSILVTGATGGFGRAFIAHVLANNMTQRVCAFSRGEHAQADMRAHFNDDPRMRWMIGDVRDKDRLIRAMRGVDLVIHAAALKRIEVGFWNPEEMVKTNIGGALNVVEAARIAGVDRVVSLSTDKACEAISAYGHSKAMMESIMLAANETSGASGPRFSVTRFGNVWASPGSVVPKWAEMIRRGAREVPVSSPLATRFYLTMQEAVELVIGTAAHMQGGELAIPDLPAYQISDLVEAFGVEAKVVGLPKWEKLSEVMREGEPSSDARRLDVDFLRQAIFDATGFNGQCARWAGTQELKHAS
jgi:UDP-N-acetylglucosamine 4,6-dehydratase